MKKKLIYINIIVLILTCIFATNVFAVDYPTDSGSLETLIRNWYAGQKGEYNIDTLKNYLCSAYVREWSYLSEAEIKELKNTIGSEHNSFTASQGTVNTRPADYYILEAKDNALISLDNKASNRTSGDLDWWNPHQTTSDQKPIMDFAGTIVAVIRNVGIIAAVIALMVIGIKEMTGSVEQKSIIKQAMPGYILGIIMVVAVTLIPSIIYNLVKSW